MNTNNVIIQNLNLSHSNINRQILKNGDQVLVRIIMNKGNGKYEGSVAGTRINIFSDKVFSKGDSFIANVKIENGFIKLVPKNQIIENEKTEIHFSSIQQSNNYNQITQHVNSPQIFSLLQSIGLNPDNLNFNILLNLKQLGMKFDKSLINKIHDLSLKFQGKERVAMEIIINLFSKGIDVKEEDVSYLLEQIDSEEIQSNQNQINELNYISKNEILNFFKKIFYESLYDEELMYEKEGILSISNNLGCRKDISGNGSWILIPYEFVKNGKQTGNGIFRILLSNENKISKFCIECNYDLLKSNFCLLFENTKCKSIQLNIEKKGKEIKDKDAYIQKIKKQIEEKKLNIDVIWEEKSKLEANASYLEELCFIGGLL